MHLDDPQLWLHDPWLGGLHERLTVTPRPFRLITFDFFDTLVHRLTAEPSDLYVEVGRRIQAQGLFRRELSPEAFYHVRIAADEGARKRAQREGRPTEVDLAAIYAEMGEVVLDPARAAALEWEVDRNLCFLNPSMASFVRFLRSLGYATAVVSDTFYEARKLEYLLQGEGFNPRHFDRVWASCEHGCAKYDTNLFRLLLRETGLHGNEVLHIGDNPVADVRAAIAVGIEPVEYQRRLGVHQAIFRTENHLRQEAHPAAGSLDSIRVLASRLGGCNPLDGHFEGAMGFGPLLARFVDWALGHYQRAGVTVVLALMREGELLGELLSRAASARQVNLKVVPCYVSRKSTATASLGEPAVDRMMEILLGGPNLAWQDVLEILGLMEISRQSIGLTPELLAQKVESPEALRWLLNSLLNSETLSAAMKEGIRESHALAFEYLSEIIGGEATVGVLDLGWSGSIQKNMAQILRHGGREIRFVGCYLANTPRAARLALDGHEAHGFLTQAWSFKSLLLEIAITAMVGSTEGYRRDPDGKVVPVLGPFSVTGPEQVTKGRIKEGILTFQDLWLRFLAPRRGAPLQDLLADIDRRLYAIVVRMLHYPTREDALALGLLEHDENYGVNYRQPLVDDKTVEYFREGGMEALQRHPECYWPQAVLARENPKLMHTLALRWDATAPMGRVGARAAFRGLPLAFGPEERHYLEQLMASVGLGQVCLVGQGNDGEALWLLDWLETRFGAQEAGEGPWPREYELPVPGLAGQALAPESLPRVLYLDAKAPVGPANEMVPGFCRTGVRLLTQEGLRRLSFLLRQDEPCLLLFSEGLPEDLVLALLRGFTPFVAPGSIVGVCHGGADPSQAFGNGAGKPLFTHWMATGGTEDRFEVVDNLFENRIFGTSLSLAMRNPPPA